MLIKDFVVDYRETDMAQGVSGPVVAGLALDGAREVLADDISQQVKAGLSAAQAPYLGAA